MHPRPSHQQDLYAKLGVHHNATPDEIKTAYKTVAKIWHPDVNKEKHAEEEFKHVGEAYIILSDPIQRLQYNNELARYQPGHHNHQDPKGHHGSYGTTGNTWQPPSRQPKHHPNFRHNIQNPTSLENFLKLFEELSKDNPDETYIKEYVLVAGAHLIGNFLEGVFSPNKK